MKAFKVACGCLSGLKFHDFIQIPVESIFFIAKSWFINGKIAIRKRKKRSYNVYFFNNYSNFDYISLLTLFSSLTLLQLNEWTACFMDQTFGSTDWCLKCHWLFVNSTSFSHQSCRIPQYQQTFIDSYFAHFEQLHFSCIRCSFEQNTKKLMIYLRSLSDKNNFLFLFIFGDIVWVPITFECYHFWSEYNYLNKYLAIIAPLWNKVSTTIKYFISATDNCPCSRSNGEATPNLIEKRHEKCAIWLLFEMTVKVVGWSKA